jgi:lysyl-tRNA synthetase class 2
MGENPVGKGAFTPAFSDAALLRRRAATVVFFPVEVTAIPYKNNFYAIGRAWFFSAYGMPSSVVANMNYFPKSSTLRIIFTSGEIYEYLNVPAAIYDAMKQAGSKGTYLNQVIKKRFAYRKVT